jgi:trehalose 6-phosphate phosphatase
VETDARTAIDQAAERCVQALQARPCGLFTDFDGTLSSIAPTPRDAVAYPGAIEALTRVSGLVDVAGIITGRAVGDVQTKMPIEGLIVVGNHGLEWFEDGKHVDHEAGTAAEQGIAETMAATEQRLAAIVSTQGMIWENKRLTASIHYRNAGDPIDVGMKLLPIVEAEASSRGLRVSSGKMLVELRPSAVVSKGTALERIIRARGLGSAIFFGDDVTDVDGFRALHRLRDEEGVHTVAVAIRSKDVHPEVIAEADVVLESVADTVDVFNRISDLLEAGRA